jgi:hypothetical protein
MTLTGYLPCYVQKIKKNKLQFFIYQPSLSYYVIDFRDGSHGKSVEVVCKTVDISNAVRNVGAEFKQLSQNDKSIFLVNRLLNKKKDRFGLVFTERYINDSVYDGVEEEASLNIKVK